VDPRKVRARAGGPARAAAPGPDQLAVTQYFTARRHGDARVRIDRVDVAAKEHLA